MAILQGICAFFAVVIDALLKKIIVKDNESDHGSEEKLLQQLEAHAVSSGLKITLGPLMMSIAAWLRDNADSQGKKMGTESLAEITKISDSWIGSQLRTNIKNCLRVLLVRSMA